MIARMWHGKVPAQKAADYHRFLLESGLKDYGETEGNKGVFLLKREEENVTHFYTLTFWEDTAAIIRFAGPDLEKAKYYPEDKDFLLEFEPFVTHFEVIEKPEEF
ncbi:MAG TPA: antibiotic biosynthesis monooxygenase [Chitinophagaceae bacterium]|nr:antibiotic biosynthesis monooxygenase [Chitinophagaceae bacterium]